MFSAGSNWNDDVAQFGTNAATRSIQADAQATAGSTNTSQDNLFNVPRSGFIYLPALIAEINTFCAPTWQTHLGAGGPPFNAATMAHGGSLTAYAFNVWPGCAITSEEFAEHASAMYTRAIALAYGDTAKLTPEGIRQAMANGEVAPLDRIHAPYGHITYLWCCQGGKEASTEDTSQDAYTSGVKHGTWKLAPGKGDSYWKPSFSGSSRYFSYPWPFDSPKMEVTFSPHERKNQLNQTFIIVFQPLFFHGSDQIIATSHDLTPNCGLVREIPVFQGNLGW